MKLFNSIYSAPTLLFFTATVLLGGCQQQSDITAEKPRYPKVSNDILVQSDAYKIEQQFTGTVRSGNTTAIGFELAGKINHLAVDSGNTVKAGQMLAKLDISLLEAESRELHANLAQNNADLQLAKTTLERSLALKKQGYTSAQQLDELKGKLNSLQAARQRLIAAIDANNLRIEKSTLTAPFNGVVAKRNHNLGEVVSLGSPLFTLIEHNNPQAMIGVPVNIAQAMAAKQQFTLTVNEQAYQATVAGVGAEVNPVTRTVPVRFTLPNDAPVLNGELAYLHYGKSVTKKGYWIPISSLTDGLRGLWNIYVLTKHDNDQYLIERRDIEIIYTKGEQAYITGAISAGEQYVTQGLHKLVVGEIVTLNANIATR
ncbi:efflux RND transporter periplasmic adaptor subunit [Shewanella psychrotolerans]|uniref:efflux RND transporter periplasmic adaptor subunit n=1 Tax=Shewanella psychrotolerans TaxID=2864206 RepID=UPI001C65C303|nr:efflux RND transporter periplasmic adaptor subunit [Shewanella psychrotolerans]QYK00373.1 efflux RND transporter periplasmic adaptor subunit [Shewanella psychrotolerans]